MQYGHLRPYLELTFSLAGNTELDKAHTNIFKVYQLTHKHLEAHPEDTHRFPNLKNRPILAKGAAGPLEGALNLAEYFVGRPTAG